MTRIQGSLRESAHIEAARRGVTSTAPGLTTASRYRMDTMATHATSTDSPSVASHRRVAAVYDAARTTEGAGLPAWADLPIRDRLALIAFYYVAAVQGARIRAKMQRGGR